MLEVLRKTKSEITAHLSVYNILKAGPLSVLCPPDPGPAEAPVLRQPQLSPHGGQSDGGRVRPHAHRRAHPHRTVPLHRVRPLSHGEDRRWEAPLQVQGRHRLDLPAPVPPDRHVPRHGQVRDTKWDKKVPQHHVDFLFCMMWPRLKTMTFSNPAPCGFCGQEGASEPGEAGGSAQGLPLPDLLLQSEGKTSADVLKSSFHVWTENWTPCVPAAVRPGLVPPAAGDGRRPVGGHAGDCLPHPETPEGTTPGGGLLLNVSLGRETPQNNI